VAARRTEVDLPSTDGARRAGLAPGGSPLRTGGEARRRPRRARDYPKGCASPTTSVTVAARS
jgi:hypothetical protein